MVYQYQLCGGCRQHSSEKEEQAELVPAAQKEKPHVSQLRGGMGVRFTKDQPRQCMFSMAPPFSPLAANIFTLSLSTVIESPVTSPFT